MCACVFVRASVYVWGGERERKRERERERMFCTALQVVKYDLI